MTTISRSSLCAPSVVTSRFERKSDAFTGRPGPTYGTPMKLAAGLSPAAPMRNTFVLITVARLVLLAPVVAPSLSPGVKISALASFVLWDVFDGVLARRFTADFPVRRLVDAYVDRVAVTLVVAAFALDDARWWTMFIFVVSVDVASWCSLQVIYRRRGVCAFGGNPNRVAALVMASWATSVLTGEAPRLSIALAIAAAAFLMAVRVSMILRASRQYCDPPRIVTIGWGKPDAVQGAWPVIGSCRIASPGVFSE